MSAAAFTEGQRVAVLSRIYGLKGVATVERITHRGTRVHVAGYATPFSRHGDTSGALSIIPATAEHEAQATRMVLWRRIDEALGTDAVAALRAEKRAAISVATLERVAALLAGGAS